MFEEAYAGQMGLKPDGPNIGEMGEIQGIGTTSEAKPCPGKTPCRQS